MKKVLSFLLVLIMVLMLLPIRSVADYEDYESAAETVYEDEGRLLVEEERLITGICGDHLDWSYKNGVLTISGYGDMYDYMDFHVASNGSNLETPWQQYSSDIQSIVLESGITYIGSGAFVFCDKVKEVIIPEGVTNIGTSAFSGCSSLASIKFPDTLTMIGNYAFNHCRSLKTLTFPIALILINSGAFFDCGSLTDIYYKGTKEQWNGVNVYENNDYLIDVNMHYIDSVDSVGNPSSISVSINGIYVVWTDVEPFIDENSRTMVPLRAVGEAMNLEVEWDDTNRAAIFTDGIKTIVFPIDSNIALIQYGEFIEMDTAAVIVNDRTYAPIRYLAEYFNYIVDWDGATRTVLIHN